MTRKPMYILGISSYSHESSCALIKDGQIRVMLEEERFNREKHTWKYPRNAIEQCLLMEGISIREIDHFTFFWVPMREIWGNMDHVARFFPASLRLLTATSGGDELSFKERVLAMHNIGRELQRHFGLERPPKVRFVEHHLCHAASAFFVSPYEEAAILTLDGRGESTSTMMSVGQGTKIEKLKEIKVPHSLGHFYAAITDHLGFRPFHDEWKVMGMSAYGKDTYVRDFEDMIRFTDDGGYRLNLRYFQFHTHGQRKWMSDAFLRKFGPKRAEKAEYEQRHFDIAFALQAVIEKTGVSLARHLRAITGLPNLCMTGGVVLNCLMNKRVVEQSGFENYFFQPVANDAGTSLGSALYQYHHVLGNPRAFEFESVYWGVGFENKDIEPALQAKGLRYRKSDNIARDTARQIADGKIVGWFQGRMESGPRALGNRSITVSPLDAGMKDRLNERVKKREFFRPFAPSVLEEKAGEYFVMPKGQSSPYMILIGDVREDKKSVIPAVTHADGTARVHTVSKGSNPRYWELITEFEKITGVPVLVNTSFNENEPIVCTPEHAVNCFLRTDFDALAIGDYLVLKEEQPRREAP
ncbi:MAG: carbamoyltransferase C-terminal domain-containing protein [Candidatus Omnitrophota bacterium]|nr:carbamoyltransferase C-terminal domain-containing protein [Candidatus Omnitrophota bacterium]MDZ4241493.1 carbamoyltransferase C-terminal domain-containing protein [Candidatus Omnitrophota bacterium]